MALLRAGHHLGHIEKEEDLLNSILRDAVSVLDAQRGAVVLAEGPENKLKLRAIVTGRNEPCAVAAGRGDGGGRFQFSESLANRCVTRGESILCHSVEEDPELAMAKSIAEGTMASVSCVLLRTPRKRLGVLHLDRSPWQKPFTRTTCTWPTPWRPTCRPASSAPSCCASSATCSWTPSPSWPRPSSCATSTRAITPTASPPIRRCWPRSWKWRRPTSS